MARTNYLFNDRGLRPHEYQLANTAVWGSVAMELIRDKQNEALLSGGPFVKIGKNYYRGFRRGGPDSMIQFLDVVEVPGTETFWLPPLLALREGSDPRGFWQKWKDELWYEAHKKDTLIECTIPESYAIPESYDNSFFGFGDKENENITRSNDFCSRHLYGT